jgi:multidrug efflux system membrane fusion protein
MSGLRWREIRRALSPRVPPLAVVLAGSALLLLAACSSETKQRSGPPAAAVPVMVADAVRKPVPVTLKAIGSVEAYNTVRVRARVGGELTHVGFTEGQNVRRGDLLFTIDPRPFETALQSALADSVRDSAKLASADVQLQRYADLVQKDYVTKEQHDEAKANAGAMRATLQADAAACENARLNLGFCSIRAPISGRTGSLLIHRGNLVNANDANPLVVIQQIVPVYVSFAVPDQYLPEIRAHSATGRLRVETTASGDAAAVHTGELTFIDNAVDETTGTILLKATFANTDESLWPGQFVNASLILTTLPAAVVIPSAAVQEGQQGSFVYVVKPDLTVALQPVTIKMTSGSEAVVDAGLDAGDRVVTDGQLRLTPGARVEIKAALRSDAAGDPASDAHAGDRVDERPGAQPGGVAPR